MADRIDAEIERLAARRQALWAAGEPGDEAKKIGDKIAALYEEKRRRTATHGTAAQRERAKRVAKAEDEVDRLMRAP